MRHLLCKAIKWFTLATLCSSGALTYGQTLRFGITPEAPDPAPIYEQRLENADSKVLRTRIFYEPRQDTPSRRSVWTRLTNELKQKTGLDIVLQLETSQLEFERKLATGEYDLAYLTPLQFLSAREAQNYRALAKRKSQPLRGLIVVRRLDKARTLRDIETSITGFSSLLDYTSSIIMRHSLKRVDITLQLQLFEDENSLINALAGGQVRAISLAESSFYALPPDRQEQYKVLWETPGYAPFTFATHPRVPFYSINKLQRAMVNLNRRGNNQDLVDQLGAKNGYEIARNSDWLDAEGIDVNALNLNPNIVKPADTGKEK